MTLGVAALAYGLVAPWGDYPINDDWMYARALAKWMETGRYQVDSWSMTSVVGQSLLVRPVVELFGFSHLVLRLCTMALAAVGLWAFGRILRVARVPDGIRLVALLSLALNPYYFYLGASFMTEIYGYVPALLAAALWLSDRARRGDSGALVSVPVAVACGALVGATFWIRQYCVLAFPALLGASALPLVARREWPRLALSLPGLIGGTAVWLAVALAYFPWASATGNYHAGFASRLDESIAFDGVAWGLQSGIWLSYVSVCLAPLLVLLPGSRASRSRSIAWAVALALAAGLTRWGAQLVGTNEFAQATWLHTRWPFLHNVIFNAGMGPVTLPEVYGADVLLWPHLSSAAWTPIEAFVLALALLWAPLLADPARWLRGHGLRVEASLFGLLLALGSLAAVIQSYRMEVIDRYHLPSMIGLGLLVACALAAEDVRRKARRWWAFGALFGAMAVYDVAALHDHFRWQDARWRLVREALASGVSPSNLQAGFEVSGLLTSDAFQAGTRPEWCHNGHCRCHDGFRCIDDSYRVGVVPLPDYVVLESVQPRYWLLDGPALHLSRRTRP